MHTEEDEPPPTASPAPRPSAPPGSTVFSLEDRPTPSLYLLGWLISGAGVAMIAVALLAGSPEVGPLLAIGGLVVLGLGLATAAGYQLAARDHRPAEAYRGPSPLILFGIVFAVTTLTGLVTARAGVDGRQPAGFLITLSAIGIVYLGVVWLFVVRGGALSWRQMGWPGWPARYGLAKGAIDAGYALLLILPTTVVTIFAAGLVARLVHTAPPTVLPDPQGVAQSVLVVAAAAVVAPIGEELFFRGFALTAWLRDLGPRSAIARSAVFFAVVHIANIEAVSFGDGLAQALIQITAILPLGIVIGYLFVQRGMVAAITAHIGFNGFQLLLYFLTRSLLPPAPA